MWFPSELLKTTMEEPETRADNLRMAFQELLRKAEQMVATTIRTVFVQPDPTSAREQWRKVADSFRPLFPKLAQLLDEAEPDVLAYLAFPSEHWRPGVVKQSPGAS